MAEQEVTEPVGATSAKNTGSRKNLMLGGVLLGVMVAEGLVVFVLVKHFGAQPATAEAGGMAGLDPSQGERAAEGVEVEVVRFRAQNERARQLVVYDVSVYATVSKGDEQTFQELIEQKQATIQDRFSSVIRAADPQVLMEADPATLRQQFLQELARVVGDEDMIRGILIPSIVSYREN